MYSATVNDLSCNDVSCTVQTVNDSFFLDLEIQRSQYIGPKVTVHKCAETIQGRKLFKGGNYIRKYGILSVLSSLISSLKVLRLIVHGISKIT